MTKHNENDHFIEQTKPVVTLAEQEKLDPSPLVLFLAGTERYYRGVGTGIPKLTTALRTLFSTCLASS
jgi:hypothetical protein